MKVLALIMCVIVSYIMVPVTSTPSHGPSVSDAHNICQANPETHLGDEIFEAIQEKQPFDRTLVGPHMVCMSTRLGTQNPDGSIFKDGLQGVFRQQATDNAKVEELTNKCYKVQGSTSTDTAINLAQCIMENVHIAY